MLGMKTPDPNVPSWQWAPGGIHTGLVVEEVDERNCVEHDEVGHLADGNGLGTRDRRLSGH
jgi:hypothetical protein